jgi:ABC-type branched-subunit amino acid transport system permease subunit
VFVLVLFCVYLCFFHNGEVLYREQGGMNRNLCGCLVLLSDNYVHRLCIIYLLVMMAVGRDYKEGYCSPDVFSDSLFLYLGAYTGLWIFQSYLQMNAVLLIHLR